MEKKKKSVIAGTCDETVQGQEGSLSLHPGPSPQNSPLLFQGHRCRLTPWTLCSGWCPLSGLGTPSAGHRKC